jgi:hypothetical protein
MAQSTGPGQGLLVIERILRDRDSIWRQVIEERGLQRLTLQMLASSAISLACYGAVLGASHSFVQAISSAIKLPLLFLATLAICLPTLYLFNLLFGARLQMMQAVALIMVSITVTAVLTLAFAPISLFFLISAHNYSFFKLLNVAILVLAAVVGLRFLTSGMAMLNHHQQTRAAETEALTAQPVEVERVKTPALVGAGSAEDDASTADGNGAVAVAVPAQHASGLLPKMQPVTLPAPATAANARLTSQRPASMTLLYIWILLFGFVGTQLAWTLRPFFGSPDEPFAVFRNLEGTFYADIFATIGRLFTQ